MTFSFITKKKRPPIREVVEGLRGTISAHDRKRSCMNSFIESFRTLVKSEVPMFESSFVVCTDPLCSNKEVDQELLESETRLMEDLYDLHARMKVIQRITQEQTASIKALDAAKNALKDATRSSDPNQQSLILEAQSRIQKCHTEATNITKKLIDQKKKYADFKVRRLKNGLIRYGTALQAYAQQTGTTFSRISTVLEEVRIRINDTVERNWASISMHKDLSEDSLQQIPESDRTRVTVRFSDVANPFDALEIEDAV